MQRFKGRPSTRQDTRVLTDVVYQSHRLLIAIQFQNGWSLLADQKVCR